MRKRLKYIMRDLGRGKLRNQILFEMLGTIDMNLEAKLPGRLFQQVDQKVKT